MSNALTTQTHDDYGVYLPIWTKCRDTRGGEDSVKAAGETYLPRLDGQTDTQYEAYKMRSRFFNAFGKTIDGHLGLATRKQIMMEVPPASEELLENVDRKGNTLEEYIKAVLADTLEVNRGGTLVDYPVVQDGETQADAAGKNPYFVYYKAEHIRDWRYDESNQLVYVLLREELPKEERNLQNGIRYRYRELKLEDGRYTQTLTVDGEEGAREAVTPQMDFKALDAIPFVFHQSKTDNDIQAPLLIDLVNLTLSHYRLKADHAHALHYAALPTPWITGVDSDSKDSPTTIGPQTVWKISAPEAKVGMLEFTGQGVAAIKEELTSMEDQMAILGSRVLLPEMAEHTATASKLRSISETSDLANTVLTLEKQFNQLLEILLSWAGIAGEVEVDMPTDFMPTEMDAPMITAMVGAWQQGAFDFDTLVKNFQKAEIIEADTNMEEMKAAIADEDEQRVLNAAKAMQAVGGNDDPQNSGGTPEDA